MDMRQLRAFAAIAEAGTFTAAAERVHVTQAAISMQIRLLEEETGVRLFVRAPRGVVLTEGGERLLVRARGILREHDAALAELHALAGGERGRLRLGSASAMVSTDPLPALLRDLRRSHRNAEVTVASGTSDALVRLILAGELDAAFVSLPVDAAGIETERLSADELVAIAHPRHHLANARVVTAQTLAGEPLILGERGGNTRRLIDSFFQTEGVRPQIAMELNRLQAIKRMAEEGMGIGIVPSQSVKAEVAAKRLVAWWIKNASINWELGIARLAGGYDTPILTTFLRLCREHYGTRSTTKRKPSAERTRTPAAATRRPRAAK